MPMDTVAKCQVKNGKEKMASDAWQVVSKMDTGTPVTLYSPRAQ